MHETVAKGSDHYSCLWESSGFPCGSAGKESLPPPATSPLSPQCRRPRFDPWVGMIPWRRERLPTPVFWPGEFHGLYSPWGCEESDMTEQLSLRVLPGLEGMILGCSWKWALRGCRLVILALKYLHLPWLNLYQILLWCHEIFVLGSPTKRAIKGRQRCSRVGQSRVTKWVPWSPQVAFLWGCEVSLKV